MQYLFGKRTGMGPAAWRGICSEDAVVDTLLGEDQEAAIAKALAKFDKRYLIGDEKTTKERDMITPIVGIAVEELKALRQASISRRQQAGKDLDHSQGRKLLNPSDRLLGYGLPRPRACN
jgi:hypothetical protein